MTSEKNNNSPDSRPDDEESQLSGGTGEILLYQTEDGLSRVECRFQNDTIWLSQATIAELYQKDVKTVNRHIVHIYREKELDSGATISYCEIVRFEGDRQVTRRIEHYSLDVVIAVGYRVRSQRGTQFRRWATQRLREYLVKGFVLDDERLKNPPSPALGVPDYFDDLLERIRDIRASERRMYLRVREIFAMAADYDPSSQETIRFFQIIQNKLHFAATGMTAAELIQSRANHALPNMGLTSWKGGEVRKSDVMIAKNYLNAQEIDELNRIVVMWLDFAEDQARRRKQVFMKDWQTKLDEFLRFNERNVLPDAGHVTKEEADLRAQDQYERFAKRRRAFKEAQGEADTIQALEDAAKRLSERKPSQPKEDK